MQNDKICRLCLSQPPICYSLFENDGVKLVESLTSLKITETDCLPKVACVKCWLNIKLAYSIQQNILETHRKLELITSPKTEIVCVKQEAENLSNQFDDEHETFTEEVIFIKDEYTNEDFLEFTDQNNLASCAICGQNYSETELSEHVKTHFSTKQSCDECGDEFDNIQTYRVHFITKHKNLQQTWNCEKCSLTFQYKSMYNIHVEKAHVSDVTTKKEIVIKTNPSVRIKKPIKNEDENTGRNEIFPCTECKKVFRKEKQFLTHLKQHKRKTCPICNAEITRYNFKKHVMIHSAGPSVCHLCGVTCKNYDSLRGHLYYTHSTNKFPCEHCGKIFKKSYSRLLHVMKEHTGEKNHICDTCGKSFFTHYCLSKHVKMTHLKLRPHICTHCNKGFSSKFALRTHVRQHTNDAPYKCDICAEGFRQNVSLRAHKKSKHNIVEEKKCQCKVCGRAFATDWAVKSHMRLH